MSRILWYMWLMLGRYRYHFTFLVVGGSGGRGGNLRAGRDSKTWLACWALLASPACASTWSWQQTLQEVCEHELTQDLT